MWGDVSMKNLKLLFLLSLLFLVIIAIGCTTPAIQDAKFVNEYVEYNENPKVNFQISNLADTSFDGKVVIQAVIASGFFDCYHTSQKNISTILPKKFYNGELDILSKNDDACKGKNFDVYFTLKDLKSDEILVQSKLTLKVKG